MIALFAGAAAAAVAGLLLWLDSARKDAADRSDAPQALSATSRPADSGETTDVDGRPNAAHNNATREDAIAAEATPAARRRAEELLADSATPLSYEEQPTRPKIRDLGDFARGSDDAPHQVGVVDDGDEGFEVPENPYESTVGVGEETNPSAAVAEVGNQPADLEEQLYSGGALADIDAEAEAALEDVPTVSTSPAGSTPAGSTPSGTTPSGTTPAVTATPSFSDDSSAVGDDVDSGKADNEHSAGAAHLGDDVDGPVYRRLVDETPAEEAPAEKAPAEKADAEEADAEGADAKESEPESPANLVEGNSAATALKESGSTHGGADTVSSGEAPVLSSDTPDSQVSAPNNPTTVPADSADGGAAATATTTASIRPADGDATRGVGDTISAEDNPLAQVAEEASASHRLQPEGLENAEASETTATPAPVGGAPGESVSSKVHPLLAVLPGAARRERKAWAEVKGFDYEKQDPYLADEWSRGPATELGTARDIVTGVACGYDMRLVDLNGSTMIALRRAHASDVIVEMRRLGSAGHSDVSEDLFPGEEVAGFQLAAGEELILGRFADVRLVTALLNLPECVDLVWAEAEWVLASLRGHTGPADWDAVIPPLAVIADVAHVLPARGILGQWPEDVRTDPTRALVEPSMLSDSAERENLLGSGVGQQQSTQADPMLANALPANALPADAMAGDDAVVSRGDADLSKDTVADADLNEEPAVGLGVPPVVRPEVPPVLPTRAVHHSMGHMTPSDIGGDELDAIADRLEVQDHDAPRLVRNQPLDSSIFHDAVSSDSLQDLQDNRDVRASDEGDVE